MSHVKSAINAKAELNGFHVYADPAGAVFERTCKTAAGARRCVDGLRRHGFKPVVRASFTNASGVSWIENVEYEALRPRPETRPRKRT